MSRTVASFRLSAMRYVLALVAAVVVVTGCSASPPMAEEARPRSASEEAIAATVAPLLPVEPEPTIVPLHPDGATPVAAAPPVLSTAPETPAAAEPAATPAAPSSAGGGAVEATRQETTGSYTLNVNSDGSPVRWNPCAAVRWQANLSLAPPGALDALRAAFDELAAATGMTFTYAGTTSTVPTKTWLEGDGDSGVLVVAWAAKVGSDLWTGSADGEGGWYKRGVSTNGVSWTWRIERGFVLIDPASTTGYLDGFSPGVSLGALLLHELAHAVGLGHVDDQSELMYPTLSATTSAAFGDGDRAGLARVGRDAGCIV